MVKDDPFISFPERMFLWRKTGDPFWRENEEITHEMARKQKEIIFGKKKKEPLPLFEYGKQKNKGEEIAKEVGAHYDGIQEGHGKIPSYMQFTDSVTGSTILANTLEEAQDKIHNLRKTTMKDGKRINFGDLDPKDRNAVLQEQGFDCTWDLLRFAEQLKLDIADEIKANADYQFRKDQSQDLHLGTFTEAIDSIAKDEREHRAILEVIVDIITERCDNSHWPVAIDDSEKAKIKYDASQPGGFRG